MSKHQPAVKREGSSTPETLAQRKDERNPPTAHDLASVRWIGYVGPNSTAVMGGVGRAGTALVSLLQMAAHNPASFLEMTEVEVSEYMALALGIAFDIQALGYGAPSAGSEQ